MLGPGASIALDGSIRLGPSGAMEIAGVVPRATGEEENEGEEEEEGGEGGESSQKRVRVT